jgi:hypothetical protein
MLHVSVLLLVLAIAWSGYRLRTDGRRRTTWAILLGLSPLAFLWILALDAHRGVTAGPGSLSLLRRLWR